MIAHQASVHSVAVCAACAAGKLLKHPVVVGWGAVVLMYQHAVPEHIPASLLAQQCGQLRLTFTSSGCRCQLHALAGRPSSPGGHQPGVTVKLPH